MNSYRKGTAQHSKSLSTENLSSTNAGHRSQVQKALKPRVPIPSASYDRQLLRRNLVQHLAARFGDIYKNKDYEEAITEQFRPKYRGLSLIFQHPAVL